MSTKYAKRKSAKTDFNTNDANGKQKGVFLDNRSETIKQAKLQEISSNAKHNIGQFQKLTSNYSLGIQIPSANKETAQLTSFNAVKQLIKVTLDSFGDVDTENTKHIEGIIDEIQNYDKNDEIKNEILSLPDKTLLNAILKIDPNFVNEEESPELKTAKDRAAKDTGGWFVEEKQTTDQKLKFLEQVIQKARAIIPKAYNIRSEVGSGIIKNIKGEDEIVMDYLNTAYDCKNKLIGAYNTSLINENINVSKRYIHPAALERIYAIIKDTAPNSSAKTMGLAGVCKDFASVVYGLIQQNDPHNSYQPQLVFMKNHIYVKVLINNQYYAVDAWFNKGVSPQDIHEKLISDTFDAISNKDSEKGEEQISIEDQYANAEKARLIWYKNKANYYKLAKQIWDKGKTKPLANRGANKSKSND